jgi:phospholipid/cholesterol/gamma-HCH transport system substrate-binding protein
MRTRTVREGSVGFLILLGLGLFGGLVLWLRGVQLGNRSYQILVEFPNVQGIQIGTPVRYRGVNVGKISQIKPGSNGVELVLEITPADLVISRDVTIEANKSGLIGEAIVDITPRSMLSKAAIAANPLSKDCPDTIICNNSRLNGQVGASLEDLIRSALQFTTLYNDPELFANLKSTSKNTAIAAQNAAQLTHDLSILSQSTKVEIGSLSKSIKADLGSLSQSVKIELGSLNQSVHSNLEHISDQVGKISTTADASTKAVSAAAIESANSVTKAANQINLTASQANALLATNRATLVATLNNINQTSQELRLAVNSLHPVINQIEQGKLINNLEVLSANAAQASANLRDFSTAINNPTNLSVLQQTLDAARITFQNTQKITSDLNELTSDPALRDHIRRIIKALGGLLGSTQQLQQQTELAQVLIPFSQEITIKPKIVNSSAISAFQGFSKGSKFTVIPSEMVRAKESPTPEINSPIVDP